MSYILDALKKNELEDATGNPESAAAIAPPPNSVFPKTTKEGPNWLLIGIIALLAANLVGFLWYWLSQPSATHNASTTPLSDPQVRRELVMAPTPRTRPAQRETGATELPRRVPNRTMPATPTAPSRNQPAPSRPAPVATTPKMQPRPAPVTPPSTGRGRVLSPEQAAQLGLDGTQSEPTAATTAASPEPVAPKRTGSSNTITIDALPSGARSAFPELEFSTHIFADDPSMRAVVVNDQRLTEGEQFGELLLRAVTEEGVIFGYRGHLVEVSIADLWAQE